MFKDLQEKTNELEDFLISRSRTGKKDDVFVLITHLLAECGEIADEIKGMEGKRAEDPSNYTKANLAKELVDVVFNTLRIARNYNIDLDDYFYLAKRLRNRAFSRDILNPRVLILQVGNSFWNLD